MMAELIALKLLTLTRIDGIKIDINPAQITRVVSPKRANDPQRVGHPEAKCLIYFTDAQFSQVLEHCATVLKMLEEMRE